MMKKLYIICMFLLCCTAATAQDFEIVSVEHLERSMQAVDNKVTEQGSQGRECALIRIATQNITQEQKDRFDFGTDMGSKVEKRANRDGEIWLWVTPGMRYLIIKGTTLGGSRELAFDDYGVTIQSLKTYKIVIRGTAKVDNNSGETPTQQFLAFRITPANAVLEVDGTVWSLDATGSASRFLKFGTYSYRVRASNYFPEEGIAVVNDPDSTKVVVVNLKPDINEITFIVDADAEIWVNNERKGIKSWTGQLGSGIYKVECRQANHETTTITQEITSSMSGQTITLPTPKPIYGSLIVESDPNFCKVFLDGKEIGETPNNIQQIIIGQHELKLIKDGYMDYSETVWIRKGERKVVHATMESGRQVLFICNVADAHLKIDAENIGNASGTYILADGRHSIKVTANGYCDYATIVFIDSNNTSFQVDLQRKGREVTFSCNAPNSVLEIDGVIMGSTSGTYELVDGEHQVKATADNYLDYYGSINVSENTNSLNIRMQNVSNNVTTSSISGIIKDNNNTPIGGATVIATHTPSGSQYYVVADANGKYHLVNIRPGGPYKLEFRAVSYQDVVQKGVVCTAGDTKILNVQLSKSEKKRKR